MKSMILTTTSLITILMGTAAYAADVKPDNRYSEAGDAISESASDIKRAAEDAYEDIKAAYIDNDPTTNISNVMIDPRGTANGMISKSIYDVNGNDIGKIHDIILDSQGRAAMVVVSDAKFFQKDKIAAFDYSVVTTLDNDGDIISPLTENIIKQAKEFTYNQSSTNSKLRMMPRGGYSTLKLLDAELVDPKSKTIAYVDNITFRNSMANHLVVSFDKVLGMAGHRAALPYKDAKLVADGKDYNYQLSANQAGQFESYKKSLK